MAVRVLERSDRNRVLAGVFGGLGEFLNVDPNILRLVGVILLILAPILMTVVYTVAALLIPRKGGLSYVSPSADMSKVGPVIAGLALLVIGVAVMGSFPWTVVAWPFTGLSFALASLAGLVIAVIGLILLVDQLRKL